MQARDQAEGEEMVTGEEMDRTIRGAEEKFERVLPFAVAPRRTEKIRPCPKIHCPSMPYASMGRTAR